MVYSQVETAGYKQLKTLAMNFIEQLKVGDEPGAYKKELCESEPSTYGAYHAACVLDLFNELSKFPAEYIDKWAARIQKLQCGNGYFSNRASDINRTRILHDMEPAWHFTRGMIWTLRLLDRKPEKEMSFLEPFLDKKTLYRYVKDYDWSNSWAAGNQICALSTALFALRDWYGVSFVDELLEDAMYPALEELIDPETGYWGCHLGANLLNGQFGTIHVLPTYFTQGWEYKQLEASVDSTLACQNPDGSFWKCGSDCPDFDGAYMLYNLCQLTDYKKEEMHKAARLYIEHAKMHFSDDGAGFYIHRKDSDPSEWVSRPHYIWKDGDRTATEELRDEDPKRDKIMLGSWFYPLSIALASGILKDTGFEGPYKLNRRSLHECNVDIEPEL